MSTLAHKFDHPVSVLCLLQGGHFTFGIKEKKKNLPEKQIVNLIIQVTLHKPDELGPGLSVRDRQN